MGFFKNFFGRDEGGERSASDSAMDTLAFGTILGIAALADAQHEEEQAKARLEELADEISAVRDDAGISMDIQFGEISAETFQDQLDELRDRYEELQDEEPEDEFSEAHEQWEDMFYELETEIDELEDQLGELEE